jgi:hypothetical protein
MRPDGVRKWKIFIHFIGSQTCRLRDCSIISTTSYRVRRSKHITTNYFLSVTEEERERKEKGLQTPWPLVLQANYTEWATANGRRILVPTFAERRVSRGRSHGTPTAVNLSFLDRSRYFSFQADPLLSSRGWVDHVPDKLLLRKSDSAEIRTRDLWVCSQELWPLDHRGDGESGTW